MPGGGVFDELGRRWAKLVPGWRLLVGSLFVLSIGLLGLTPKALFGMPIAWPHAALWAAIGWGMSGISIRPLVLLSVFGLIQDVYTVAPLGCFMLVNLTTFGAAAWLAENFDLEADPLRWVLIAPICIAIGFFVLWVLASSNLDYGVTVGPLVGPYITTLLGYLIFAWVFRLQSDPIRGR